MNQIRTTNYESSITLNLFNAKYLRPLNTDIKKGQVGAARVFGFHFNKMWIKFGYKFVKNIYEHGNAENSRLVGEDRQQ